MYKVNNRKVFHSINFIIAHDGFTLRDLVTYNSKHNKNNGENNRDGSNDNESWNCGCEGETEDWEVSVHVCYPASSLFKEIHVYIYIKRQLSL